MMILLKADQGYGRTGRKGTSSGSKREQDRRQEEI